MVNLLLQCLKPTNSMVKNLVMLEQKYINTHHPDFMDGGSAIFQMFDNDKEGPSEDEKAQRMKMEDIDKETSASSQKAKKIEEQQIPIEEKKR